MASKDRKTRYLEGVILLLSLALNADRVLGQSPQSLDPVETPDGETLRKVHRSVMDRLARTYGSTDFSAVTAFLVSNPGYEGNPNIMFIPLSLGNVYLNRYEEQNDTADFERSLGLLAWVAGNHWLWGYRWLSAPVANYLDVSLLRLRRARAPADFAERIETVWRSA